MQPAKVEGFSDGVFAVAMTLLVYQVEVPEFAEGKTNSELLNDLAKLWPYYIALLTSFLTILIMWVNHHQMFRRVRRIDRHLMFANGFLLLLITIVPYPTAMVSTFLLTPSANTACAVYAGTFAAINLGYNWLWYAVSHSGAPVASGITQEDMRKVRRDYLVAFPVYALAFIAAFVNPFVSFGICTALWVYWVAKMKLS